MNLQARGHKRPGVRTYSGASSARNPPIFTRQTQYPRVYVADRGLWARMPHKHSKCQQVHRNLSSLGDKGPLGFPSNRSGAWPSASLNATRSTCAGTNTT